MAISPLQQPSRRPETCGTVDSRGSIHAPREGSDTGRRAPFTPEPAPLAADPPPAPAAESASLAVAPQASMIPFGVSGKSVARPAGNVPSNVL